MRELIHDWAQEEYGIDPLSSEFIFSNNYRYVRGRNARCLVGRKGMSLLALLLRYDLNDEIRSGLFSSYYELGNPLPIPSDRMNYDAMADAARKLKEKTALPMQGNNEFETIRSDLKKKLGLKLSSYKDKQNTLRVIFLVHRLMQDPATTPRGRGHSLLNLIEIKKNRSSYEARPEFPIDGNEHNTWLLSDLREYLTLELPVDRLEKIDSLFEHMITRMHRSASSLDDFACHDLNADNASQRYSNLHDTVLQINLSNEAENLNNSPRLDEDLYVYLKKFEFLNYCGGVLETYVEAQPPRPILAISEDLFELTAQITGEVQDNDPALVHVPLAVLVLIATQRPELFKGLIAKATNACIDQNQYKKALEGAADLCCEMHVFATGVPLADPEQMFCNVLDFVSALCAVFQAILFPTNSPPYIFGQGKQAGSLNRSLGAMFSFDQNHIGKEIPEKFPMIWRHRFEWVRHDIQDHKGLSCAKYQFRSALVEKFMECMRPRTSIGIELWVSTLEHKLQCCSE